MSELVTVYRSRNPLEVQMIQTALESAGLTCHVEGDHQGGYSGVFDIQLVVRSSDEAVARDLLKEFQANAALEPEEDAADQGGDSDD